jgi:hypothetical protein
LREYRHHCSVVHSSICAGVVRCALETGVQSDQLAFWPCMDCLVSSHGNIALRCLAPIGGRAGFQHGTFHVLCPARIEEVLVVDLLQLTISVLGFGGDRSDVSDHPTHDDPLLEDFSCGCVLARTQHAPGRICGGVEFLNLETKTGSLGWINRGVQEINRRFVLTMRAVADIL